MKKETTEALTADQQAELKALAALPDRRIDTSDIPEVLDWSDARRGVFYRPVKKQITLRLDADVVTWFKSRAPGGRGYQTEINRALREYVREHSHHAEGAP
ncbi:MAG: BrnA antitoxin family protein [Gammaproteobacteria bacterium]|nr:BrnA antitoxin family protein [Gammaproteobacteria bacterium]